MYQIPLFPTNAVTFTITTNAVANTFNNNVAIIPAPGLGLALRIVYLHVIATRANTGNIEVAYHAAGGPIFAVLGIGAPGGGNGNDRILIPEPGMQLPVNTALQLDNIANVVTQGFRIIVYFYTDQVT